MLKSSIKLAQEIADKGDWKNACEIIDDELKNKDLLNDNEKTELRLTKIDCYIRGISFVNFSTGKICEDGSIAWNTEYGLQVMNLIREIISLPSQPSRFDPQKGFIENPEEKRRTFENYYLKVTYFAKQKYLQQLDEAIAEISENWLQDGSARKYESCFDGYNCLFQLIKRNFIEKAENVDLIKEYTLDDVYYNEAINYQKDKLFDKGLEICEKILQSTNDFPYYCDIYAVNLYMSAIFIIQSSFPEESDSSKKDIRISRLKYATNLICDFLNSFILYNGIKVQLCSLEEQRKKFLKEILSYEKEIQKHQSDYTLPQVNMESSLEQETTPIAPRQQSSGCYIATAVYGSYDCPQVWTLRRYRDNILATTWCGRVFIKIYYVISPTLVRLLGHTKWFKKTWQEKLDRLVAKLQSKGVESTPYKDKVWK